MRRALLGSLTLVLLAGCGGGGKSSSSSAPTFTVAPVTAGTSPTTTVPVTVPAPNVSPHLKEVGAPSIPAGSPGQIAVVMQGPISSSVGSTLPVIVRNNSSSTVHRIAISATARTGAGQVVATGSDQGFQPNNVQPGEYAIGHIYFQSTVPAGVSIAPTITSQPGEEQGPMARVDLTVAEANKVGDQFGSQIVGTLTNQGSTDVGGPLAVDVLCFSGGQLSGEGEGFSDAKDAPAGSTVPYTVRLTSTTPCGGYVVGAGGFSR